MVVDAVPNETKLRNYLNELKSRKPNTKFRLVHILVEMGKGWHSFKAIRESGAGCGVSVSHLLDNLLELCRKSDFLESDFREKYYPRLSSFRIINARLPLLRKIFQEFDKEEV